MHIRTHTTDIQHTAQYKYTHIPTCTQTCARTHTTTTHTHDRQTQACTPQYKDTSYREAIKLHFLGIPRGYQLAHFRLIQRHMTLHVQVITFEATNHICRLNKFTRRCIIPNKLCLQNDLINYTYKKEVVYHVTLIM